MISTSVPSLRFEKINKQTYIGSRGDASYSDATTEWENIKLPQRATVGSAGYDFYLPYDITFKAGVPTLIPTGIRWIASGYPNVFLMIVPRSGLGFKYGMRLVNTTGIIDSDYYQSDNGGHIMAKITTDSDVTLKAGTAFMQGIILPFIKAETDNGGITYRNGGFGSTDVLKKSE